MNNPIGTQTVSGAIALEVVIYPNQNRVYFPDNAVLRDKVIKHVDLCDEILKSFSGMNITFPFSKMTFFEKKTQNRVLDAIPSEIFSTYNRNGNRLNLNHVFDLPMSYIDISNNQLTEPKCMLFVFWYVEKSVSSPINDKAAISVQNFELKLNQKRTYFSENNTLRDAKFRNIITSLTYKTAEGNEVINENTFVKTFLTLRRGNLQFFQNVPLYLFKQDRLAYWLSFENIKFDFTNSYIEVINPQASDFKSVFFNCIIEK
jgi:hypothetical protein